MKRAKENPFTALFPRPGFCTVAAEAGRIQQALISKENSIHTHVPPQTDVLASVRSPTPDPARFFQHCGRGCMLRVWTLLPHCSVGGPAPPRPWVCPGVWDPMQQRQAGPEGNVQTQGVCSLL